MSKPKQDVADLIGRQFNRWEVLKFSHRDEKRMPFWWCRCSCGTEAAVNHYNLVRRLSRSCGCLQRETFGKIRRTHGKSKHHLYMQWRGMIARCHNPNDRNYRWWGARGIKVCKRWHNFNLWLEDMEPTWSEGMTIERINVNGNYKPSNVRWATQAEQARNTRRNYIIDSPWGRLPAAQIAAKLGMNPSVFMNRFHRGWPPEKLFSPKRFRRSSQGSQVDASYPDRSTKCPYGGWL